ncbi:hypothetical protein VIGAN_01004700 [Vigna angularis var. angularis]|uniref:Homologous recombination OB-fold protein OB-fold domain-containing protein n=2 Tax=Phaseolus angularis TaxID=3914 RepID=A0A0S3QWA9_PHAAN|nr:uncharacterized protein LOC108334490 [Vigna angularis]BAT72626.1 hypothetical protein VIGAN_01004700 [Vigna angularis var. angularis]
MLCVSKIVIFKIVEVCQKLWGLHQEKAQSGGVEYITFQSGPAHDGFIQAEEKEVAGDFFSRAMEMEPWEALGVDESDLSAFLRPCNAQSTSSSLIPGPAGAVQAVMSNRCRDDPLPTQEFIRRVGLEGHRDFSTNPWLCAIRFVCSQGMVDADDVAHGTPLNSIKNTERVPLVVAVIKSCTPNGLGDMKITLKDPTATVSASVHRKVLAQPEFGKDFAVGSVVVLREVAVFCPTRSTCYLNVTLRNVLQVFSKDCGPPSEQLIHPVRPVMRATPSTERPERLFASGSTSSPPLERNEEIMSGLRFESSSRQVADIDRQRAEVLASTSSHRETVSERENLPLSLDNAGHVEVNCVSELDCEMEDQPNPPELNEEADSLAQIAQGNSSTSNSVHTSRAEKTEMEIQLESQRQMDSQRSSVPHWTDEQLDELLAFD